MQERTPERSQLTQKALSKLQKQPSQRSPRKERPKPELPPALAELIASGLVKDIGISHTTLEEVFLKVTGESV